MASFEEDSTTLLKLESACSDLKALLNTSAKMQQSLVDMDKRFNILGENVAVASQRVAPLQSSAMATKALETRINRAVSPAMALLDNFTLLESLQHELFDLSTKLSAEKTREKRLNTLLKYVDCVDELNDTINSICQEGEAVIQKLQEVVEFISRTKATDKHRRNNLRDTLITLKALYEKEVEDMRFEGLLDEALLKMQDEFEILLQSLKHQNIEDQSPEEADEDMKEDRISTGYDLGSALEVEILQRISETLAANDCLDICISIYIKIRYGRTAKALMRLNPNYLRTYTPEEIDEMEWENLETAISLWIQHFSLAIKNVLISEKKLCNRVLGKIMDGVIWGQCFTKISDKIMAVFFRFGEGVARSSKEPQKLFKLLDMFDSLEKNQPAFAEVFEGEAGENIYTRFRELKKLLIHASSKVFWGFGLQIESDSDGAAPKDGSVPKLVRYAINYLKYLVTEDYSGAMGKVLLTEHVWRAGTQSSPDTDENLLKDAILNVMEALQRNIDSKTSQYKDKVLSHIFTMNTHWYIYMRTRSTELSKLLEETYMKKKYKMVAEESAYLYQKHAWGAIVKILDLDELRKLSRGSIGTILRIKIENFLRNFEEAAQRHRMFYCMPDVDLREQIHEATSQFVIPPYTEFLNMNSAFLSGKSYPTPETLQELVGHIFDGNDAKLKKRGSIGRSITGQNLFSGDQK